MYEDETQSLWPAPDNQKTRLPKTRNWLALFNQANPRPSEATNLTPICQRFPKAFAETPYNKKALNGKLSAFAETCNDNTKKICVCQESCDVL